ncbi:MAG: efflux RND transporter periplasmic adaptor subunit [Erythrobacter sp.]|jgi:RND family efflux transporter MFP subunit
MNYETGFEPRRVQALEVAGELEPVDNGVAAMRRRRIIIVALVGLALAIAAYFVLSAIGGEGSADDAAQLPTVSVVAPGRTTVEGEIVATGTLAARRDMPVGAVGEGGRVIAIPVEAGDWVRQGQVLAVIDRSVQTQQAQSAAAQVQVAQADANLAQGSLDRALKLVERGFISAADIDRLTATRDAANARVRVAQAQLRELQARNARLNIVAPASGLLLERNVEIGQTVSGGAQSLFRIARDGEMEMLARVGEGELSRLSQGVSAEVTPVGSGRVFAGNVWQLSPTINAQDRQGTVRIALAYAPDLRPGGFATARIRSGTVVAPVLPESAIMSDDSGSYVLIVGGDNKVEKRTVTLGTVTDRGIIINSGLDGKEQVVLRAGGFLNPGEAVKPVKAGA